MPQCRPDSPVRANQSAKLDRDVPRAFNLGLRTSHFPPPPKVEDEAESLAREHGSSVVSGASDEEPPYRGDVEQNPILLPVPEFNPERRFVLVSGDDDGATDDGTYSTTKERTQGKVSHEANTSKKYVSVTPDGDPNSTETAKRRGLERRKSRQDLPRINTGVQEHPSPPGMQRSRSATYIDHRADDGHDQTRPPGDGLLSPVMMHSTKGRDYAYWDFNPGANSATTRNRPPGDDPRAMSPNERRRGDRYRATHSLDPPAHVRSQSNAEPPKLERRASERNRYGGVSSHRVSSRGSPPQFNRSSSYNRRHASPPREEDEHSSESYARGPRSNRRRQSTVSHEDRNYLLSPDKIHFPAGGVPKSPLASPRIVQNQFPDREPSSSPRNATFQRDSKRYDTRPVSPLPPGTSPPRQGSRLDDGDRVAHAQARSRATSINQAPSTSIPIVIPIPIPGTNGDVSPIERRKSPLPPSYSRAESTGSSPPQSYRQPPPGPAESHAGLDRPVVSYRRYLEDVQQGVLAPLPECRRKGAQAGHVDWLTLPRSVNFDICPDCYESVFAQTLYKHSFVPAPLHGADKPITCDFGTSPWYKIAWLMTLKYGIQDLHLLQGIEAAVVKGPQCSGSRPSTRIWYSILDPYNRRPISNFTVCHHCAKSIEVILPNLTGIFVPLDSAAEPSRGVCAMHFAPGRKRFVDLFDLLETVSDKALSRNTLPDFQRVANKVRDFCLMPECMRDEPVREAKWFVMEPIPDFTVCEECFDEVVWPIVEADETGGVARKFFQRSQRRSVGSCQLYSDRMRDVFRKACRRNDMQYLEDRVKERLDIEAAIKAKLAEGLTEAETRELVRKWAQWE